MRLRGCSVGGDGTGNEVGVVSVSDGGDGEGVGGGCGLAELTGVESGGGAGGEGWKDRVGGLRGVTCMRSRSCNDGVSTPSRREGGQAAA